jgi:hypothetical protein
VEHLLEAASGHLMGQRFANRREIRHERRPDRHAQHVPLG